MHAWGGEVMSGLQGKSFQVRGLVWTLESLGGYLCPCNTLEILEGKPLDRCPHPVAGATATTFQRGPQVTDRSLRKNTPPLMHTETLTSKLLLRLPPHCP